jgi:hypothetical protein
MANFIQVTPFMHVTDLEKALAFFADVLVQHSTRLTASPTARPPSEVSL